MNRDFKTLLALMLLAFWVTSTVLAGEKYVLKGKVMDTDDNWLNGAKVTLKPIDVKTQTDANGEFTLEFTLDKPLEASTRNILASLIVERHGHINNMTKIRSMKYFSQKTPVTIKLKPQPVDPNLIGFTVQMDPKNAIVGRRTGTDASFYVFIPESVKTVKAAFYLSMHGMGDIKLPILQKFAEEESLALVGMNGDPIKRGITNVALIEEHINKLAELSGHPELATAPIMTFGHSNGTGFSASFPRDWPERVIAWIAFHPGFSSYLQFPNTEKVPAMVMCGSTDKYFLAARQDKVVATLRKERNAAMNIMMEADVGHSPADADATWVFVTDFLKAAIRTRLNDDGTLNPVAIEKGWLGATYNLDEGERQLLDIAPYAEFKGDKSTANWLPDAVFAKKWEAYGNTEPERKNTK